MALATYVFRGIIPKAMLVIHKGCARLNMTRKDLDGAAPASTTQFLGGKTVLSDALKSYVMWIRMQLLQLLLSIYLLSS